MYQHYTVYSVATGLPVGGVEAQSAEQAIFRLFGGEWGRSDYTTTPPITPTWEAGRFKLYRDRIGGILLTATGAQDVYFQPGDEANALERDIESGLAQGFDIAIGLEDYLEPVSGR